MAASKKGHAGLLWAKPHNAPAKPNPRNAVAVPLHRLS